ncbi:MAG: DUF1080 domain-containing protein [Planctomycetota bacterium]
MHRPLVFCAALQAPVAAFMAAVAIANTNVAAANDSGFVSLFDGESLDGWDGNPELWRVEAGAIVGETSDASPIAKNEFLIWEGDAADFVLRLKFRISDRGVGNSGVQYRSKRLAGGQGWAVGGYQADIHAPNIHMGILYEEGGRGIVAKRGSQVRLRRVEGRVVKQVTGSVGDPAEIVAGVSPGEWQEMEIVARGNRLEQKLNGKPTVVVIDDDPEQAAASGLIALQVHRGPAMKVEFKDIRLKTLPADE